MNVNSLYVDDYNIYSVELTFKNIGFLYKMEAAFESEEIIKDLFYSFYKHSLFNDNLDIPDYFSEFTSEHFLIYEITGDVYIRDTEKYKLSNGRSDGDLNVNQIILLDKTLTFEDFKIFRNKNRNPEENSRTI